MAKKTKEKQLTAENQELRARLEELEETLRAIRSGEVDALVISGAEGEQVYTLKGANQPYRVLVETMNEGTSTVAPDGTVLYSNNRLAAMLRMPLEKVIGISMRLRIAEGDRPIFDDLLKKGLQTDCHGELSLKTEVGTVPVQFSLSPVRSEGMECAVIVITDLTEQKKSEEALRRASENLEVQVRERTDQLRESEERYRSIIELSPDAIAIHSEGRYVFVNPAAVNLFGAEDPNEIIGKTVLGLVHPNYRELLKERIKRIEENKDKTPPREIKILRIDGSVADVEVATAPIIYMGNSAMQLIFRDITARRMAEEEVHKLTNELKRSNEDLKQFASAASHDLQEPLRGIAGFVKLLEKRYKGKLDEKADEYIDYIVDDVNRMQMLIKDLLEYSRVSAKGQIFKTANCAVSLELALSNLRTAIEASTAEVTYDPLPVVMGDAAQLTRLFQNVIGNAIKFRGKEPLRIYISARQKENEWIFSIRDNGIGIDPEQAERVFVIFQRLHARQEYPGTGIGLAICKRIVERHGGRIWLESEPGKGSVFYFTIPA
jgi:PAS domain S-box-containing protein